MLDDDMLLDTHVHARSRFRSVTHPDRIAAGMTEAGLPARILDALGETHRNAIICGGKGRRLKPPRLLMKPSAMVDNLVDDLRGMAFRSPRPCDPMTDEDYRRR